MASKRTAISKKTRFDVFKRDAFKCQYCGASPPEVLLEVDHVIPVSIGGQNDLDNLITSCQSCNSGKSNRSLEDIPKSLKEKTKEVAEREQQLRAYYDIMEARRQRIEQEEWEIAEILFPGCSVEGIKRGWLSSIRSFVEKLGFHETLDAAEIAKDKYPTLRQRLFLYFCGICWNKIRRAQ